MMWFTYKALSQGELSDSDLSKYELEFHESVSNLVGSQMLIAALDHSLYERVTPLVSEAIELGGNTYVALKSATEDATAAEAELSDANAKALALIKKVPHDVANLLRSG